MLSCKVAGAAMLLLERTVFTCQASPVDLISTTVDRAESGQLAPVRRSTPLLDLQEPPKEDLDLTISRW